MCRRTVSLVLMTGLLGMSLLCGCDDKKTPANAQVGTDQTPAMKKAPDSKSAATQDEWKKDKAKPTTQPAKASGMGEGIDFAAMPMPKAQNNAMDPKAAVEAAKLINGGLEYLVSQVNDAGGWSINGHFEPAVTAMVLKALMQHPGITVETPIVKRGYERMLSFQQEDGAIYVKQEGRSNYATAICVCGLAAANDPKFKPAMDKAVKYLRSLQIAPGSESRDETKPGEKITADHPYVGGVSYGAHGRPDMMNLGWWMEAMHDAGVPADDPAMKSALAFVTRSQNLSETNKMAWAQDGTNDGGMIYAPAQRDVKLPESKAGIEAGRYASYGSISYVGMKRMLYAGLNKDDPRVKALYGWLRRHWAIDRNPGMPKERDQQSLYYYYLAMSKALEAYGEAELPDAKDPKIKINWRNELVKALAQRVQKDGSWKNPAGRWEEGNPVLATVYNVLALENTLAK